MFDLFKYLKGYNDDINKDFSERPYWDRPKYNMNKNNIGPDGNYYNEETLYNEIKRNNKNRLIKFG